MNIRRHIKRNRNLLKWIMSHVISQSMSRQRCQYNSIYTTGPLNAWIWLAVERSKVCNYFRETHGKCSSRHRITCPYHFAKWFALFQMSLQPKTAKEPKPTTTLAKQINSKQMIQTTDHLHVFATKLHFIMYGKHIVSLSSPSQTVCTR